MLEHDHPPAEHAHGRVPTWAVEALACADALYNLAHYLTGNVPDAEDLVQETYARAFHGADGFAPGTHLRAWLYRILKNAFVSDWRKWRRESLGTDEPGNSPAEEKRLFGDAELERLRGVLSGELQAALMALPEDGRMVILLHLEGLSEAQVAYALGCPAGTEPEFKPITDMDHWGVVEKWSLPTDGYGDCEDYAISKFMSLRALGVPNNLMRVEIVRDLNLGGIIHAVLSSVIHLTVKKVRLDHRPYGDLIAYPCEAVTGNALLFKRVGELEST